MTPIEPLATSPVHILLVDDDDGDAKAVQRAFVRARIGNPFRRAIDGIDALEILRGDKGKPPLASPRLLLVDLNMPRMNGIELVAEIRADPILQQLVIFILTTSHRDEDMTAAYDLHVAGYILKEKRVKTSSASRLWSTTSGGSWSCPDRSLANWHFRHVEPQGFLRSLIGRAAIIDADRR